MSLIVVRTRGTHRGRRYAFCTNYSRGILNFGGVLRTTALRRYKMAGPRLGVSPIALLTPLPPCTVPPVNVHSRFSFSLLWLSPSHIQRAVTSSRMHTVKITLITHFGVFLSFLRTGSDRALLFWVARNIFSLSVFVVSWC